MAALCPDAMKSFAFDAHVNVVAGKNKKFCFSVCLCLEF
jgi:hypothetical protein